MAYIKSDSFISTGASTFIELPTGADWMRVYNATTLAAAGAGTGVEFYWAHGMPVGSGIEYIKTAVTNAIAPTILETGGFEEVDTSSNPLGAINVAAPITGIAAGGVPPVVTAAGVWNDALVAGDVVRIINMTGATQLNGMDFTVSTVTANTRFTLRDMAPIAAATNGLFRKVKFAPIFYPAARFVTKAATVAGTTNTLVTLSVTHGYTVGQKVSFRVPAAFGMVQLNGLQGNIVAIGDADADGATNTVTVDIDSTTFTAFAFPLTGAAAFSPAMMVPVGETATLPYMSNFDDAERNVAARGIILGAGVNSPAGVVGNVIYWIAGKN